MGRLYGDSTPFPYDVDYLEIVRASVRAAVRLLLAQQAIDEAMAAIARADASRVADRARLERIGEAVRQTVVRFDTDGREARVSQRVRDAARSAVDEELGQIEGIFAAEQVLRKGEIERAQAGAVSALEDLLRAQTLPGSTMRVIVRAEEESNTGSATVVTPFGVEASFRLDLDGAWSKPRRVAELLPLEIHVPHEAGWISKRMELQRVKLDKLIVSELSVDKGNVRLVARKYAQSGPGYVIELGERGDTVRELGDDGAEKEVHAVESEDRPALDRLIAEARAVAETVSARRSAIISASFDGVKVEASHEPRAIATKLVSTLAPIVNEIERRSGGVDELILRRDVEDGRREEKYVKKAELREQIIVLPLQLRMVFEPVALVPRSSLTPPPPLAAAIPEREEVSMELIDDE
jgi:hypothetical protein